MKKLYDTLNKNRLKIVWYFTLIIVIYLTLSKPQTPNLDSWLSQIPYFDKIAHFIVFAALSAIGKMYIIKTRKGRIVWHYANFICVVALGGAIELIQPYVGRECSLYDFYADIAGALAGIAVGGFLYHLAKRFMR